MKIKDILNNDSLKLNYIYKNKTKQILRWILQKVLNKNEVFLILNEDYILDKFEEKIYLEKYKSLVEKKPLEYILNEAYFLGEKFYINENVLIPRIDTEILVLKILELYKNKDNLNILDLGTGSGIIAISLALFSDKFNKKWNVSVCDISNEALNVAKTNAKNFDLNINFIKSDWFSNINEKNNFDIIVSNPPYIDFNDLDISQNVKKFEPKIALFAKNNGLLNYEIILKNSKKYLNNDGIIIFEHGFKQKEDLIKIIKKYDYNKIKSFKDNNLLNRIMLIYNN